MYIQDPSNYDGEDKRWMGRTVVVWLFSTTSALSTRVCSELTEKDREILVSISKYFLGKETIYVSFTNG